MGNLINNPEFGEAVRKHLRPGDETALARYRVALEECALMVKNGPGGILTKTMVTSTIELAADMTRDASAILIATTKAHSASGVTNTKGSVAS